MSLSVKEDHSKRKTYLLKEIRKFISRRICITKDDWEKDETGLTISRIGQVKMVLMFEPEGEQYPSPI